MNHQTKISNEKGTYLGTKEIHDVGKKDHPKTRLKPHWNSGDGQLEEIKREVMRKLLLQMQMSIDGYVAIRCGMDWMVWIMILTWIPK